jgi:hypothetical protein
MADLTDMPVPSFAPAFVLTTTVGETLVIGRLATGGTRRHRPYPPGRFSGHGIEGVLRSGSETLLHRPDGVTVVEAVFLIEMADGAMLRLIGTGYETDAPFAGTRLTIVIEADEDGPLAALTTRAFAAERPAGSDTLTIFAID